LEIRLALTGSERVLKAERGLAGIFEAYRANEERISPLNRMLYADAKVWLPEDLLLKADKMTMATGVELRVPFLDHRLVEFTAGLPDHCKVRDGNGKWILRQAVGSLLPSAILHRSKKGFPIPAETWFRFELRDLVRDTLLGANSACREYFDPQAVEEIVTLQERGRFRGHQEVWSLLVFESWHKKFIEDFVPAHAPSQSNVELDVVAGGGA